MSASLLWVSLDGRGLGLSVAAASCASQRQPHAGGSTQATQTCVFTHEAASSIQHRGGTLTSGGHVCWDLGDPGATARGTIPCTWPPATPAWDSLSRQHLGDSREGQQGPDPRQDCAWTLFFSRDRTGLCCLLRAAWAPGLAPHEPGCDAGRSRGARLASLPLRHKQGRKTSLGGSPHPCRPRWTVNHWVMNEVCRPQAALCYATEQNRKHEDM